MPPPLIDKTGCCGGKPHPQFDAAVEFNDVERKNLITRLYDALAQTESNREIAQISRRAHHHGRGTAIIGQRNRGFLRDQPRTRTKLAIAPDLPDGFADGIVHLHSAASVAGAMRREWRACSS